MDDHIVDVEVIAETRNEPPKMGEPLKVASSDRSVQVSRYTRLFLASRRYGLSLFMVFLLAGFAFSILYSQAANQGVYFVFMIIFWACCALAFMFWLLGFLFRRLANKNMAKDPNYRGEQL